MKKFFLTLAVAGVTLSGFAQEKYLVSALTAMKESNWDEAKEDIDKAMSNPETSEKPKALFTKVQIYFQLQDMDKYKASNPYSEGFKTAIKLAEVKPDYEKADVDQYLLRGAYMSYNAGVREYNDKHLEQAVDYMQKVVKVRNLDGGKRFEKHPSVKNFDTVAAGATQIMATSAYFSGKDDAVPLLVAAKNNPISRTPSIYACLIDAYFKLNKNAEAQATITEARQAFPDDPTIRNYELNSYIKSDNKTELVKKLEEAGAKEPNNADIQFNIATVYLQMANPKGKKPANAAEMISKAEAAYTNALRIAPDNPSYNYNFGALYYNQAIDLNNQMNDITGTTDADTKKYDGLKAQRDATFGKAMPYFEKANGIYSKNESSLSADDRKTYKQTLLALKEIYARQGMMDKSKEMGKKYDDLNK